jgi:hypothetical protein
MLKYALIICTQNQKALIYFRPTKESRGKIKSQMTTFKSNRPLLFDKASNKQNTRQLLLKFELCDIPFNIIVDFLHQKESSCSVNSDHELGTSIFFQFFNNHIF